MAAEKLPQSMPGGFINLSSLSVGSRYITWLLKGSR